MNVISEPVAAGRVLVVDDLAVNRLIAAAVLTAHGYSCDEAASVPEALALLEAKPYDALVLDLDFGPGARGGFDLLTTVRGDERWDSLRTIVLTAHPEAQVAAFDVGASDYIVKPFEPRVLAARVARTLRERARILALTGANRLVREGIAEAAAVQRSCLPTVPSCHGNIAVSGAVVSHDGASGDHFDVVEDRAGRVSIIVVDVAGHGVAAAMVGASVRVAAREALERGRELHEVLAAVHSCLRGYAGALEGSAAVGLVRFDELTRSVEYVNAGLPAMVYRGADGCSTITSMGPPLGFARQPYWSPRSRPLRPGDAFAVFTDGAIGHDIDSAAIVALAQRVGLQQFGATLALADAEQLEVMLRELTNGPPADDATIVIAGLLSQ